MIHAETSRGRFATLRRAVRHPSLGGAAALGFALSATWSDPTLAVGLGPVTQQSALGQSLRVVVPVLVSPGEDIGAECFRLGASEREVDGVPQLAFGRMSLERTADGAHLVITNAAPVTDPVVRITVQAGCDRAVRREYVLLMDPPPIETPVVAAESSPPANVAQAPETAPAATPARRARGGERAATGGAPRSAAGEPVRAAKKPPPPPKARTMAKSPPKRPARVASDSPRLTVSSAAPLDSAGPGAPYGPSADPARAQQELANAIEAETVVLQRRIVELTAMVDQMQEQLRAAEAAQRGTGATANAPTVASAATPASAPTPAIAPANPLAAEIAPVKSGAWSEQNWPLLSAIVGMPLLLAMGLLWRRRSQRTAPAEWPSTRMTPNPEAIAAAITETRLQNTAAGMAEPTGPPVEPPPPKPTAMRRPATRASASSLAVSELLHATEEARVYVALGHPERAIDVLTEHIRQVPRSLPAAWLMLLGLYRDNGREQDFRRLAEEFHLHCNVQAPAWDSFGAGEYEEGGLETFPHILREVTRTWRQPGCREYLERLLYDNREGRRMGFPLTAYSEILLLLQILDAPAPVDIDSDLVSDGRLEPVPKPAPTSTPPGNRPGATEPVRIARAAADAQRPTQRPLDLEPDGNERAGAPAKKLSS
jgi:hypothetical protein